MAKFVILPSLSEGGGGGGAEVWPCDRSMQEYLKKLFIVLYYRQLSALIKVKKYEILINFVSHGF